MKQAANDAIPVVLVVSEYITELVRLLATSLETLTRGIAGKRRLTKEHGSCQDNVDLHAYIDKPSRHLEASSLLLQWPVATFC
ncbi:hypothetical protein Acr_00g0075840 [Actinidia rufa]|uniref:Uncharacterized protein n=1 Tax=Actinidia rufa TaxID=165716 RepID=A0A7J0DSW8_9ERIC|nr:hypothetical protein Acr_00g0075840 [Actinidia rufa]